MNRNSLVLGRNIRHIWRKVALVCSLSGPLLACSTVLEPPHEETTSSGGGGGTGVSAVGGMSSGEVGAGGALSTGGVATDGSGGPMGDGLDYYDFSSADSRGAMTEDFSPYHKKGQCALGQAMTGLSVEDGCTRPRVLQCEDGLTLNSPTATVNPSCGDDRRDTATLDWNHGYRKGECGASEAVVGISRDSEGGVHDLLCAETGSVSAGACTVRNVTGGDNRGRTETGDWDGFGSETECAPGEYVKGVSLFVNSRRPRALLCCTGEGDVTVTEVNTPQAPDAGNACSSEGADTVITPFDKAHMHGGSRYVYSTVNVPEEGLYDKITMTFTLACPGAGCDPWDRWGNIGIVVNKHASDPGRDQIIELGRFVTPYGVGGTFTYDLTALRPALSGELQFRLYIDTWVDGWLATAKITMEGGRPNREPIFVTPLWTVPHVAAGDPTNPIANSVPLRDVKLPKAACDLSVRAIITGHGQGNSENCAEFCPKKHYIEVEGNAQERTVWRDDCETTAAANQLGNWKYPRAGWCPGADVRALNFDVGGDVPAAAKAIKQTFSVGYDVEGYENTCRPSNCQQNTCVFDTSCDYDNGAHTQPHYSLTALLIGYR